MKSFPLPCVPIVHFSPLTPRSHRLRPPSAVLLPVPVLVCLCPLPQSICLLTRRTFFDSVVVHSSATLISLKSLPFSPTLCCMAAMSFCCRNATCLRVVSSSPLQSFSRSSDSSNKSPCKCLHYCMKTNRNEALDLGICRF